MSSVPKNRMNSVRVNESEQSIIRTINSEKIYPFNDISIFLEKTTDVVDCYALATNGVGFRHVVVSDETEIDVR